MSRTKTVVVGPYSFRSVSELHQSIRRIVAEAVNEAPLAGFAAEIAGGLFDRHPRRSEKVGSRQIQYFTVSTAKGGSRCFYVVFTDGTMVDFSWKKLTPFLVAQQKA